MLLCFWQSLLPAELSRNTCFKRYHYSNYFHYHNVSEYGYVLDTFAEFLQSDSYVRFVRRSIRPYE